MAGSRSSTNTAEYILAATIGANTMTGTDANPYGERNELLDARRKAEVCYKNGYTLRASPLRLRRNSKLNIKHSTILSRNIEAVTGGSQHAEADAHHIVAWRDMRAEISREILFKWNIGINDADNGVYLPRSRASSVPGLENAKVHRGMHNTRYHNAVYSELALVTTKGTAAVRAVLRDIRADLLADTFHY